MNARRIIFINRFYWPEEQATAQLLTDLAEALVANGHTIAIVTSSPARATIPALEHHHGVEIHRVRSFRASSRSLLGRMLEFASFYPGALWTAWRQIRRGDVLVAMTDPPLIGVLASLVARMRRSALVHWIQDIYPEVAIELTGHRWLTALRPLRNHAWRRASACLVPGADMARAVLAAGVAGSRVFVTPNWAPQGLTPASSASIDELRSRWGVTGRFVVGYSGNLGRVHDLAPVLELAAALQENPEFLFLLIGDGAQKPALEQSVHSRRLPNVRFLPAQPRDALAASLGAADVHLVTLVPGAERWVFPSKLYGITRVGRPVIVIGAPGCELARLVCAGGYGAAFTRTEINPMVAMLRKLHADKAYRAQLGAAARAASATGLASAVDIWTHALAVGLPATPAAANPSPTR